jgi:putative endonuclease
MSSDSHRLDQNTTLQTTRDLFTTAIRMHHFIYILKCADDSLYTGYTTDVERRIAEHHSGTGSKYVRSRLPALLIYKEKFGSKENAMKREFEIKSWSREEKIRNLGLELTEQ